MVWDKNGVVWEKNRGVLEKNGGVWEKSWGVCRALHVMQSRLQGVRRRRAAVEDVASFAKAVGSQGSGGGQRWGGEMAGLAAGLGGGRAGAGNVWIVSEEL